MESETNIENEIEDIDINPLDQILSIFSNIEFIYISNLDFQTVWNCSTCCKKYLAKFYYNDIHSTIDINKFINNKSIEKSDIWKVVYDKLQSIFVHNDEVPEYSIHRDEVPDELCGNVNVGNELLLDIPLVYYTYEKNNLFHYFEKCVTRYFHSTFNYCGYPLQKVLFTVVKIIDQLNKHGILNIIFEKLSTINEEISKNNNNLDEINKVDIRNKLLLLETYIPRGQYPIKGGTIGSFKEFILYDGKITKFKPVMYRWDLVVILWNILDRYFSKITLPESFNNKVDIHPGVFNFIMLITPNSYNYNIKLKDHSIRDVISVIYVFYKFLSDSKTRIGDIRDVFHYTKNEISYAFRYNSFYEKSKLSVIRLKYLLMKKRYFEIVDERLFEENISSVICDITVIELYHILQQYHLQHISLNGKFIRKLIGYIVKEGINNSDMIMLNRKNTYESTKSELVFNDESDNSKYIDCITLFHFLVKNFDLAFMNNTYLFLVAATILDRNDIYSDDIENKT